ncbi:hypothetical protein CVS40_8600 [Lucilia cuprina]|nr:hypothetical protein CVS40_8600 [Lucilia cuprina]
MRKGKGMIMNVNNKKPNYIYWNDPNELVDRLRLYDKSAIENSDTRSNSFNFHEMSTKVGTSSPKKDFQLKDDVDDCDDGDDGNDDKSRSDTNSVDTTFNSANNSSSVINLSLLQKNKLLDTTYGRHKNINNTWKFGNSDIEITDEKINIANQNWALTPGLIELLFYKEPKNYEPYELEIYKNI